MKNPDLILAYDKNGKKVTAATVETWLNQGDKKEQLAQFLFDRLHGRYIRPFSYPREDYKKFYKNGFTIMANCCLLIETYMSFKIKEFRDTDKKSERCFGYFFVTEPRFSDFREDGLSPNEYLKIKNKFKGKGVPHDFYLNVRCGILHNGETRNGWKIVREKNKPLFNKKTKEINAVKFMNRLKFVLGDYKRVLISLDYDKDPIWENFKNRLQDILNKA